jgi:hypothetical protein
MISFEDWIKYVFDRPVPENLSDAWYWQVDTGEIDDWEDRLGSARVVEYLTNLFEQGAELLSIYSNEQLNQGFWYLVNNNCSSYMFSLLDKTVPWESRKYCLEAIVTLFEKVFAVRCSSHMMSLNESDANPLNMICNIWWCVIPFYGRPKEPEFHDFDQTCLNVMERILQFHSIPCREGALHGLASKWRDYYPKQILKIIDNFIDSNPYMRRELKAYAIRAKTDFFL